MSGADKNKKNDLGWVCGDVLKMPGAMPGKRDIKWPIYVPFFRTGLKINVQIQRSPGQTMYKEPYFQLKKWT